MPLLPSRALTNTAEEHLADHNHEHKKLNNVVYANADYEAPNDDTGNAATLINQAITDVSAAGGGGVVLDGLPGTYRITTPILNKAKVHLKGFGIGVTTIKGTPAASGFPFLIQPTNQRGDLETRCTISDLTLDGNLRAGGWGVNQGGLLYAGTDWDIQRVRFYDTNYFKLWMSRVSHVSVRKCIWESTGGANDNIGGGTCDDILIEECFFASDISGNVFDLVRADNVTFRKNYVAGTQAVYFEGCRHCTIEDNYLYALSVKSDGGYAHCFRNPQGIRVHRNHFEGRGTASTAIELPYAASATLPVESGGSNVITGNVIRNYQKNGIRKTWSKQAAWPTVQEGGDVIADNTVVNTNMDGTNTVTTGQGVLDNAGIVLHGGRGDVVRNNTVVDRRNEIQVLTFTPGALSGTLTLTHGADTTSAI